MEVKVKGRSAPTVAVEFVLLGWPPDGPTLRLDHQRFAYAGKFIVPDTGKAVAVDADSESSMQIQPPASAATDHGRLVLGPESVAPVVAAASFSPARDDETVLWIRYVDVRTDYQGDGIGSRLCRFVVERAAERGFQELRIAVNNPFSYEALHRAGFGWTGDVAGLAELVLSTHASRTRSRYQAGLDEFRARRLDETETTFLDEKQTEDPPPVVVAPEGSEIPGSVSGGAGPSDESP